MIKYCLVCLAFVIAPLAFAQDAVLNLLAPSGQVVAGHPVKFNLVVLNPAAAPMDYKVSLWLYGELTPTGGGKPPVQVALQAESNGNVIVPPQGFVSRNYTFALPDDAIGQYVLTVRQPVLLRAVLEVQAPLQAKTGEAGAKMEPIAPATNSAPLSGQEPQPMADKVQRSFVRNFAAYEPIYFIYGLDAPAVKFQFSFQYQVLSNEGYLAQTYPFLKGIHFAYSQRSLWDIKAYSSPFYDTSYMPELFYASPASEVQKWGAFSFLGWQAGFMHESNGRDGPESRSMNKLVARAGIAIGDLDGWNLIVVPKIWAYVGDMSDNADLNDYRGYGELQLVFGKNDNLRVAVMGRAGQSLHYGAVQVDVTYPLDVMFNNFAAYLLVQYWNGYGESLLNYNKRSETIRAGISIVR